MLFKRFVSISFCNILCGNRKYCYYMGIKMIHEFMNWLDGRQEQIDALGNTFLACFLFSWAIYYFGSKPDKLMDGWGKASKRTLALEIRRNG